MARRAVILAGGEGQRLRPYTTVLPKPLMPVGDRPILDVVLRQLARHGFERATISTGYLAELVRAVVGDGSKQGLAVDYVHEDAPLGTAGALAMLEDVDDDLLVMNGDVLTALSFSAVMDAHRASGATLTIAARRHDVQVPLGVLELGDEADDARLTTYVEKPTLSYEASMGVYGFSPRAIEAIEPGERLDFPDLVLRLVAAGEPVRAHRTDDLWLDIGRIDDYEAAQEVIELILPSA